VIPQGKVRARLTDSGLTHKVRKSAPFVPNQLGGRLRGGRRGAKRDLAVAVNGVIGGVGRSFYLQGSRTESFEVIVPEGLLHPGYNQVRVFQVLGRGPGVRLRPLGGN
jgi:hypothetical protein